MVSFPSIANCAPESLATARHLAAASEFVSLALILFIHGNRACLYVASLQVPYLEDPNTGVKMFESAAIVDYLNATYALSPPTHQRA